MSEQGQENPFEDIDIPVIEMLNKFDEERHGLYDWLSSVAVESPDVSEYQEATSELITSTAGAFRDLTVVIRRSSQDIDGEKAELEKLWQQDDNERVELLSQLVGHECFEALDGESVSQLVDDLYQESDDGKSLAENTYTVYRAYLAGDVELFAGHVQDKHDVVHGKNLDTKAQDSMKIEITMPEPGVRKHVLDVAKIALGATIAIVVARRYFDKSSEGL